MDEEAVQRIQRIAAIYCFTDPICVITEGQISNRFEVNDTVHLDHHGADRHAGNRHLRTQAQTQERQLVAK